jgi:hypothetical protein
MRGDRGPITFFDRIDADLPRELEVQRAALAAALDL